MKLTLTYQDSDGETQSISARGWRALAAKLANADTSISGTVYDSHGCIAGWINMIGGCVDWRAA